MAACTMLTGYSSLDPTPDVECAALAAYVCVHDPQHFCCEACFSSMADDPDLQSEYRATDQ